LATGASRILIRRAAMCWRTLPRTTGHGTTSGASILGVAPIIVHYPKSFHPPACFWKCGCRLAKADRWRTQSDRFGLPARPKTEEAADAV